MPGLLGPDKCKMRKSSSMVQEAADLRTVVITDAVPEAEDELAGDVIVGPELLRIPRVSSMVRNPITIKSEASAFRLV
jgi:hypothetical protein